MNGAALIFPVVSESMALRSEVATVSESVGL